MKNIFFITFVFFLAAQQAASQNTGDDKARTGSVYSQIGIGIPVETASSSADGMGALGVSFYESNVPGLANPAMWGSTLCFEDACFGLASGGFGLQTFNATDYAGSSANAVFSVNNFQLQLPVKSDKLGVSVSVSPLTRSNYRIFDSQTRIVGSGSGTDTLTADVASKGSGGVNSVEVGLGWKISNNFSLGYAASLVLSSVENNISSMFTNANYQGVSYTLQTSGIGMGNRFGALLTLPRLFKQGDQLRFGATVNLPVNIDAERIQNSDKQLGSNSTETVVISEGEGLGEGNIRLPLELAGGVTYQFSPTVSFTTEGLYEQWSDFKYSFNPLQQNFMTDRYKGIFGIRYFPFVSGSDTFFSRFKYRAGVSYDTGHLQIDGRQIETLLFSAGLGIPSSRSYSSVDISFHYGIRGTEAQNLVKESIWGLKLSINLAEVMFNRPKLQ